MKYYGISGDRMLVIHDDIDVPFGKLKISEGVGTEGTTVFARSSGQSMAMDSGG